MKIVFGNCYFAVEAASEIPKNLIDVYKKAVQIKPNFVHNLVKISSNKKVVSLLYYPELDTLSHPYLQKSCTINISTGKCSIASYKKDNPMILHQLETMLSKTNPRIQFLKKLTREEMKKGLFSKKVIRKIGRLKFWNQICKEKKQLSSIVEIKTSDQYKFSLNLSVKGLIPRHKTAMGTKKPSTATVFALKNGFIKNVIYDFGCGRGRDSNFLRKNGFEVISFDPYFKPENNPEKIDFSIIKTILINFVLNVIEDPKERESIIQKLLDFSKIGTKFVISVRSYEEIKQIAVKSRWKSYSDGFITSTGTFQHGYKSEEFKKFVEKYLKVIRFVDQRKMGIFCVCER